MLKTIDDCIGDTPLQAVTAKQIKNDVIDPYKAQGKARMGQKVRSVLIDVFKEAVQAGEVPSGFNPADDTKPVTAKVKRARLTLDAFKAIVAEAEQHRDPWAANSMTLALLTAQRLEDIATMQFSQVREGYLEVITGKYGNCLKIALDLRLEVIWQNRC